MKITFITGNKNKFAEAHKIIPDLEQSDINLTEMQSVDPKEIIKHKLNEAKKLMKGNLVVEDTSLYFECLNGLPGPLVKWFLKTVGNEGLAKMVEPFKNNRAEAKVIIGFNRENGSTEFFEGSIKGSVVTPRGNNGYGWDPIFIADGMDKTFGELTIEEKEKVSMRGEAFRKLADFIAKH